MRNSARKNYPEDFKTIFGLSVLPWLNIASIALISNLLLYLTDYSGIGKIAATLGTVLLFVGRIADALDDPLQGWIIDNAKPRKIGKYKPFIILSIILSSVSVCMLYSMPKFVVNNSTLVIIWVIFFYLMYDIGASFFADDPLKQSLTTDAVIRAKLTMYPRTVGTIIVIPFTFLLPVVTAINSKIGNMHDSYSILVLLIVVPYGLLSLFGTLLVKEGAHADNSGNEKKLHLKDFIKMFKTNKPMSTLVVASLFNGFIWTIAFATVGYYLKWAHAIDPITGVVSNEKFGFLTGVLGIIQLFMMLLGNVVAPKIIKKTNPVVTYKIALIIQAIAGALLYFCMLAGLLQGSPVLYFILHAVIVFGAGLTYVPGRVLLMECMDYGFYKTGIESAGMVNSVMKFIEKAQVAISSGVVGLILVAIGYSVNTDTNTFGGDVSQIPVMLNSFIFVSGMIPAILAIIAVIAMRSYPIDDTLRVEIGQKANELKQS